MTALKQAINITVDTLQTALQPKRRSSYKFEYELEAEISYGFRRRGAMGHAFDPMIGAGRNAATIHSLANASPVAPQDLVVVDVGAEVEHYDADITRTISINRRPNARQQAVYQAVLAVHKFALSLQKPGALIRDNERAVEEFLGRQLLELGLITTPTRNNIRRYFPHATSHFLGIDPHDAGDYNQPLVPGVVLTVEPGIYIPEENLGARIEDDILITNQGFDNLSGRLSYDL